MTALYNTYRPNNFDDVLGQDAAVGSLEAAVEAKSAQCFLLSGPSGCGKTTLARIAAAKLGCDAMGIMEIDAATHTGIEQMREVQNLAQFCPLGASASRAIIIDEAHGLSRQAWESLLKITEEPPPDVYWFFCSTQPEKMPKTMQTRSLHVRLKEVDKNTLSELVEYVAAEEGFKLRDEVRQIIVSRADGSPRQALVNLDACRGVKTRSEAAEVLQSIEGSDEAIILVQALAKGGVSWTDAMTMLEKLNGANPESIRIMAMNYFAAAARKAMSDRQALFFLDLMEQFSQSYANYEAQAQLLRSIGRCVFRD